MSHTKTSTQLNVYQTSKFDKSLPQDCPVSFQTHSQFSDFKKDGNKDQSRLFGQVYDFICKMIEDDNLYNTLKLFLTRNQAPTKREDAQLLDQAQQNRFPIQKLSFKKMHTQTRNCSQSFKNMKVSEIDLSIKDRRKSKRVSIVIFKNEQQDEKFPSSSDSIMSKQQLKTLRQVKLPSLKLTQQLVREIYQTPSPFLMNLSLCLFIRYCVKRNMKPEWDESAWILAISTILAFKIYYDQKLEGMFEYFESILKITKNDLVDLERCFLQKIDYNLTIQNYDYQFVLSKFVQFQKQKENKSI